ncbi:hypothetical protein B0H17DRAFT_1148890 [Mycena rosella]|uniref:Uncharacterized protein n=1 Tax=Mycena rosella TaxID=1033263 RepID=A0AAD7C6W2_MYCRO|nr:hypothetical protein B0H17DRAFT_1148890 [Mycena rosella]
MTAFNQTAWVSQSKGWKDIPPRVTISCLHGRLHWACRNCVTDLAHLPTHSSGLHPPAAYPNSRWEGSRQFWIFQQGGALNNYSTLNAFLWAVNSRDTANGRAVDRAVPSDIWKWSQRAVPVGDPSNRRPLPSRARVAALVVRDHKALSEVEWKIVQGYTQRKVMGTGQSGASLVAGQSRVGVGVGMGGGQRPARRPVRRDWQVQTMQLTRKGKGKESPVKGGPGALSQGAALAAARGPKERVNANSFASQKGIMTLASAAYPLIPHEMMARMGRSYAKTAAAQGIVESPAVTLGTSKAQPRIHSVSPEPKPRRQEHNRPRENSRRSEMVALNRSEPIFSAISVGTVAGNRVGDFEATMLFFRVRAQNNRRLKAEVAEFRKLFY